MDSPLAFFCLLSYYRVILLDPDAVKIKFYLHLLHQSHPLLISTQSLPQLCHPKLITRNHNILSPKLFLQLAYFVQVNAADSADFLLSFLIIPKPVFKSNILGLLYILILLQLSFQFLVYFLQSFRFLYQLHIDLQIFVCFFLPVGVVFLRWQWS